MDPPAVYEGRRVVEQTAPRHGDAQRDCGAELRSFASKTRKLLELRVDEGAPLDEVLRGVPADDLLWKDDEGGAVGGRTPCSVQRAVDVRARGPDRGVDVRE